jgi:hypothetical protein
VAGSSSKVEVERRGVVDYSLSAILMVRPLRLLGRKDTRSLCWLCLVLLSLYGLAVLEFFKKSQAG